jgi:hypothetical protein
MFDQVIQNMRKATEVTVQLQQEMFKKWVNMWTGVPGAPPIWGEQAQKVQTKWAETVTELLKRQRETTEAQFKAGMQNIEKAFQLGEVKTTEELRVKTIELWKQCFESVRQAHEAQMRDCQVAVEKWFELVTKPTT